MGILFSIVAKSLMYIAHLTGSSYNEINIIVYYILVPFVYFILIDKIYKINYFRTGFAAICIIAFFYISDFRAFSDKLFIISQDFLNSFDFIGLDYITASGVICVIIPLIIFVVLIIILRQKRKVNLSYN